ncbi:MAG: hypothetical protein J6T70_07440 [Bacteroidales bacterium]|nr:hypothetical protein [Bacteroidales bacterium]
MKNKNLLKFLMILSSLCLIISSCQNDETNEEVPNSGGGIVTPCPIKDKFPVSKAMVITKPDSVFFMNTTTFSMTNANKYRTLKIRNLSGSVMQEWLLDDLHETCFYPYWSRTGDTDGTQHGFYYKWYNCIKNVPQSDWDFVIRGKDSSDRSGFRVPKESDLENFAALYGSTAGMTDVLQIEFDGYRIPGTYVFEDTYGGFWLNFTDANVQPGCGVMLEWYSNNPTQSWHYYPSNPDVGVNVRLMRNLTTSQW